MTPTAARVTRARGALRWRIISTVVSAILFAVFVVFFGANLTRGWLIGLGIAWGLSTVFWLAVSIVSLTKAKRDLGRIPEGVAFYLDGRGVEFAWPTQASVPWADVTAFKLVGRDALRGTSVVVERRGSEAGRVPVSFLDATPEMLDSAARAYSLGRVWLDVSALDRVF